MLRRFALMILLGAACPAPAVEFATLTTTAPDQLLSSAPLGDRTVAVTAEAIRIVDWSRPEGWRDSTLVAGSFGTAAAHAWGERVYVRTVGSSWYAVREAVDGRVLIDPVPVGLRPPNARIGEEEFHLEAAVGQVTVYRALAPGGAVSTVEFTYPLNFRTPVFAGDRAVAIHWLSDPYDPEIQLQVADLSDPASPRLGPIVSFPGQEVTAWVIHDHALLTVGDLLNSYDLTDVDQPAALDQLGPLGHFRSPFVRDDGMLAVWHGYDLRLYDCSDPADIHSAMALPFVLDAAHPYGGPLSMDHQRVVSAARHGAQQFLLPQGSGGITDGGVAWWRLEGSLLAATDRWAWVQGDQRYAVDLIGGGTGRARIAGAQDNGGLGWGTRFLAHHAGHLFYARGDGRLRIEDVADPLAPVLVNSLDGGFDAIALADDLLAAARGLRIEFYDVSSPAAPVPLGLLEVDDHVAAVGLHGDRSYAVIRTEGRDDSVSVFDLADPTAPELRSAVAFDDQDPETLWQVAHHVLHGTTLLLDMRDGTEDAAFAWRTNAIDLQDPAAPVLTEPLGYADFWSHVSGIAPPLRFAGHHAVADGHALRLYRYTGDPGDGSEALASHDFARQIAAMQASGTRLAVLSPSLLRVFTLGDTEPVPVPDGTPAPAVTVAPNPFNPRTTIAFTMRRPGRATVAIHDLRGRLVRTLAAELAAGPVSLVWDGADDDGRALASGAYLVRVTTPTEVLSARCALVR